ncbi:MAG: FAD-dependent oxidoreductase [Acidobacteria bacterium]|nr:FAD-dependent oxidoreductase [Acidobacteriota bacterium]
MNAATHSDVLIVGAGVAGLAAASALSGTGAGARVTVVERKPFVGGRAYSYLHPALQERVDCQHVLLGCCTNLRYLAANAGVDDRIRWYDQLNFLEPNGRLSRIQPGAMPAPLHASFDFLRVPMLSVPDKVVIARGLLEFMRGYPLTDGQSFSAWLKRTGQTQRAIKHFWEPVIVGALNDRFENCSLRYAGQVFHEGFLKSAEGGRLGIPAIPLSEFFGEVAKKAEAQGTRFLLGKNVDTPVQRLDGRWWIHLEDESLSADALILAVPFEQVQRLLPPEVDLGLDLSRFTHAPITTLHLWFDREITDLDHAVLLDTGVQWLFNKGRIRRSGAHYVELVISASHAELHESRDEITQSALRELAMFFPAAKDAKLLKNGILKEARATFSVLPGLDAYRPQQTTQCEGLFLAGDWTRTGWPSTMEGGVRSGYLAAEAVTGNTSKFLQPDLPGQGLMRFLAAT